MTTTACSVACYPGSSRPLAFLEPTLREMFSLFDRYLTKWDRPGSLDRPYAYNERATLSLFAGGVWRSNRDNMLLEEYCDKKQGEAGEYRGRYDIWFEAEAQSCYAEAKQTWPSITAFDDAEANATIAILREEADSAYANIYAGAAPVIPCRALGIVFVVPYLAWKFKVGGDEQLGRMSATLSDRLQLFTSEGPYSIFRGDYIRPDLLADDRFGDSRHWGRQTYPGVIMLICEKRSDGKLAASGVEPP